jgi:hypothetical protein
MTFRTKWAIGCVGLAGIWVVFALTKAPLFLGLAGAAVAVFGAAMAQDWRGVATAMRRAQAEMGLRQPTTVYRLLGYFTAALGLAFIAAAVFETA